MSHARAIRILTRQCRNKLAQLGTVLTAVAQLKDLEDLVEDCRHRRANTDDDRIAAQLANVEVMAHKAIALMRTDEESKKGGKNSKLDGLSDQELESKRLHLVKELSK
jgi:hypothetical protein